MGVFERAVVLLLEHSDKAGSVGIILNLPAPLLVNDVSQLTPAIKGGLQIIAAMTCAWRRSLQFEL